MFEAREVADPVNIGTATSIINGKHCTQPQQYLRPGGIPSQKSIRQIAALAALHTYLVLNEMWMNLRPLFFCQAFYDNGQAKLSASQTRLHTFWRLEPHPNRRLPLVSTQA